MFPTWLPFPVPSGSSASPAARLLRDRGQAPIPVSGIPSLHNVANATNTLLDFTSGELARRDVGQSRHHSLVRAGENLNSLLGAGRAPASCTPFRLREGNHLSLVLPLVAPTVPVSVNPEARGSALLGHFIRRGRFPRAKADPLWCTEGSLPLAPSVLPITCDSPLGARADVSLLASPSPLRAIPCDSLTGTLTITQPLPPSSIPLGSLGIKKMLVIDFVVRFPNPGADARHRCRGLPTGPDPLLLFLRVTF